MIKRVLAVLAILPLVAIAAPADAAPHPVKPTRTVKGKPPVAGQKSALTTCSPECYNYAGQKYAGTGLTATKSTLRVTQPFLQSVDYHSLSETAVQGGINGAATQNNTIEVGVTVDRVLNGDDLPHIFVFAWYDNAGVMTDCDYNGKSPNPCGYIDKATNPINAGSSIAADIGTEQAFEIFHYGPSAAWIINYKGTEIGRYPDSLNHSAQFTTANLIQNFGEMATGHIPSCSQMATGVFPNTSTAYPTHGAESRGFNVAAGGSYAPAAYTGTTQTLASSWAVFPNASGEFRFGGPGAGAVATSPSPCP